MPTIPAIMLKPVVRFRRFPFDTIHDPSMSDFMREEPWENQERVVQYLRSGLILGVNMGADLTDWFDPGCKANPLIDGQRRGGVTEMTDGVWFWYAGLIYFIEKYHVCVPREFVDHAAQHNWNAGKERVPVCRYDFSYFKPTE